MDINQTMHGFTVTRIEPVPALKGRAVFMKHYQSGADLLWLDHADTNKTFCIGFKTIPDDHTGVFHIIEHSVLGGSEKYPVKEPFVELLKGSLSTFLNAMTFPDKTLYPVSTKNDKELLNLMDCYLDAVLHTNIYTKPETFYQEGWHYEMNEKEDMPFYNGVVYNEMKGAFSSVDELLAEYTRRAVYPDTSYFWCYGGDPENIPELTYEKFLDMHRKYYHPANSVIVLDGSVQIEPCLEKIHSFLKDYEDTHFVADIYKQTAVPAATTVVPYEINADEDEKGKTYVAMGRIMTDFDNQMMILGMQILTDVLVGTNTAPLKKAILDTHLCEDMDIEVQAELLQPMLVTCFRNTDQENVDELKRVWRDTLHQIADNGIDRKQLQAAINIAEFQLKQRENFGARGVLLSIITMESWMYDGDPLLNISYDATFEALRKAMDEGFFEWLINEIMLNEDITQTVILVPSKTLAAKRETKTNKELATVKESWSDEKLEEVLNMNKRLKYLQQRVDTPEELACMPRLNREDLDETMEPLIMEQEGNILYHPCDTEGVVHLTLYFKADDLGEKQVTEVAFMTNLLKELNTENFTALDLQSEMKLHLGDFGVSISTFNGTPYIVVNMSCLEAEKESAFELIREVLLRTDFSDVEQIQTMMKQRSLMMEQVLASSGISFAALRMNAYEEVSSAIGEYARGLESMKWVKKQAKQFDEKLPAKYTKYCKTLFTRDRLTVSLTGEKDVEYAKKWFDLFEEGKPHKTKQIKPLGIRQECVEVPSQVGYALQGGLIKDFKPSYRGKMRVVNHLLTFSYLWNEIRVQGGAYGTSSRTKMDGMLTFNSFRDPQVGRSLEVYRNSVDFLKNYEMSDEELTKTIIGTLSEMEQVQSFKQQGQMADALYLNGYTEKDRQQERKDVLNFKQKDIKLCAKKIEEVLDKKGICVIAGKSLLDQCKDLKLKKIKL